MNRTGAKLFIFSTLLIASIVLSGCTSKGQVKSPMGFTPAYLNMEKLANLTGVVYDGPTGKALDGVMVTIAGAGWLYNASTDDKGRYSLKNIPSGRYAVLTAVRDGYEMGALNDIVIEPHVENTLDLTIEPAEK